jgi:hypothetical protein
MKFLQVISLVCFVLLGCDSSFHDRNEPVVEGQGGVGSPPAPLPDASPQPALSQSKIWILVREKDEPDCSLIKTIFPEGECRVFNPNERIPSNARPKVAVIGTSVLSVPEYLPGLQSLMGQIPYVIVNSPVADRLLPSINAESSQSELRLERRFHERTLRLNQFMFMFETGDEHALALQHFPRPGLPPFALKGTTTAFSSSPLEISTGSVGSRCHTVFWLGSLEANPWGPLGARCERSSAHGNGQIIFLGFEIGDLQNQESIKGIGLWLHLWLPS